MIVRHVINTGPQSLSLWVFNPRQTKISQKIFLKIMYQKWKKIMPTIILKKVFDQNTHWQTKKSVTNTGGLWQKNRLLGKIQSVCDRHKKSLTDNNYLWHIMFVIDKDYLWQSKTFCDRHILSVKHTDWLWQTQTVYDRHSFFVTDTYCLWQTPVRGD